MDPFGLPRLGDMPVFVSQFVPETVNPPPCETLRDYPARRGGKRTDFGRYFRRDSFIRGGARPALMPQPGFFVMRGELHVHPKTWEKLKLAARSEPGDRSERRDR